MSDPSWSEALTQAHEQIDSLRARAERAEAALAEERRQHVESRRELSMARAEAQDVARRQREACAVRMAQCSWVWADMVRETPLVTDENPGGASTPRAPGGTP